jgi:serine/threonine protein kinase
MDDFTDKVIKGYELRARIGAGGFGAVYRAYQPIVARDVAIKIVLPQYANHPDFIRRFEAEALLVARLEHAHIVPLYDYWREPGGAYLVMRWLRGGSLRAALRRGLPPLESVARQLEQITAALAMAHRQGVVHRDVKPDNILLDEEGDAYLADFGIAKDLVRDATLSITGQLVGSPAYLSPEQVKGDPATPHSDIYSLGITLYEWLTGQTPFSTTLSLFDVMQKHLSEPVPSLQERRPDLPRVLDEIIQKATAKDPAHRFPDARSVALVFRQAITPGQTFESPTRPEQPEKPMVTPGAIPAVPEDEATFTPGNIAEALGATRWHDEGTVAGIHTPDLRNPY